MNLTKKSIVYLSVCGTVILGVVLISLYSNYRTLEKLDKQIARFKYRIENQQLFAPLYQNLLLKMQSKLPEGMAFPEEASLAQEDTGKMLSILQEMARESKLQVEQLVPDVDSSIDGSKHLMINIFMRGELAGLRNFLLGLVEIPYFEHIEQISIESVESAKKIQLRIWMAKA